jgi:hypothetical protein
MQKIQTYTYIPENNKEKKTNEFIKRLWPEYDDTIDGIFCPESYLKSITGKQFLKYLLNVIDINYTIICEEYHVDKCYRDAYYLYFSNQHFQVDRYCIRLTLMKGRYSWEKFLSSSEESLMEDAIGSCVIKPKNGEIIGRVLLNPIYFIKDKSVFLRKTRFEINVYGKTVRIDAFPYQMQDGETMRCSEVTLLNLMEYYSNHYSEYKSIVPSEIIASEQRYSHERVLPSKGITYHVLTRVLSDFGFSPRLYNVLAMRKDDLSGLEQSDELERIMHYYVESGIPVAVNLEPFNRNGIGHSLICIGHSGKKNIERAKIRKKIAGDGFTGKYGFINSADYYEQYVVIDDNQFPYEVRNFDMLSLYKDMRVTNIAVPLYKRMFLEAADAYDTAIAVLESEKWGVVAWSGDRLTNNKNVVVRLFLASSRSFKKSRVNSFGKKKCLGMQMYYAKIRMPKFIWVCELYVEEEYGEKDAFGEIVLDGTTASKKGIKNIILLNYPEGLYVRNPDQPVKDIDMDKMFVNIRSDISPYTENLQKI